MTTGSKSKTPLSHQTGDWLKEVVTVPEAMAMAEAGDLDARIEAYQQKSPYPKPQIERTEKRVWLAEKLPKNAVGAEIGVFRGHFAEVLGAAAFPRLLYLVDPWTISGETFR